MFCIHLRDNKCMENFVKSTPCACVTGKSFPRKYSPQTPAKVDNNNYCNLPLPLNVICYIILVNVKVTGSYSFYADASDCI